MPFSPTTTTAAAAAAAPTHPVCHSSPCVPFSPPSKAHKILTDEVSRQNYEKYGSPDGPQYKAMNIALPSW